MEALRGGMQAVNTTRLEQDYGVRVPVLLKSAGLPPRPGRAARDRGLRPKHPVRGRPRVCVQLGSGAACLAGLSRARNQRCGNCRTVHGAAAPPSRLTCLAVLGRVRSEPRGCCCAEHGAASVDKRAQECGQAQVLIALALSRAL